MDHVVPKSKGGKVEWTNIVLACVPCNGKKGNSTVAEAGLKLLRKPFEPRAEDLQLGPVARLRMRMGRNVPKAWNHFLGPMTFDKAMSKMYWSSPLES